MSAIVPDGHISGSVIEDNLLVDPVSGKVFWRSRKKRVADGQEAGTIKKGSSSSGGGYRVLTIDQKQYRSHHIVWAWVHGRWPDKIDHENRDRDMNHIDNLREATEFENKANRQKLCNNKSGFKWVSWHPTSSKWRAEVRRNGKRIHDSLHIDPTAAYQAACTAAQQLHGPFFNPG